MTIHRGDIYFADLPKGVGSEEYGTRPVIVLSNNEGNRYGPTLIVAAVTGRLDKKPELPVHCQVMVKYRSLAMLEQIHTVDKKRLGDYIGKLDDEAMSRVDEALAVSVGLGYPNFAK